MPHFDVTIANPPYNAAIRIFEKILDTSDIAITIQPTKWLLTEKQNKLIINKLNNSFCNIKIINGNECFNAIFAQDISINYIDKTKKAKIVVNGNEYSTFSDIKKYSLDEKLNGFNTRLGCIKDSIWGHIKGTCSYYVGYEKNPDENWWIIKVPEIRGNVSKKGKKESEDFYTIISCDENLINRVKGQYKYIRNVKNSRGNAESGYFAFETEDELNGFIRYIKTDFVRACLMLSKTHNNQFRGCFKKIPWFDFTEPIFTKSSHEIDNWLFSKYKISDDIRKHIEEILPDYYKIRPINV